MIYDERDILIMTMTAWDEARGEGQDGIRAQVHSVINRFQAGRWYSRKTLAATCLLGYAYSAWNSNDPNRVASAEVPMDEPLMALCRAEVTAAVSRETQDPTNGATHYYAVSMATPPTWADPATGSKFTVQIGKHMFYKDVR